MERRTEAMPDEKLTTTVKCNLTGMVYAWYNEMFQKKLEYYGTLENMERFFVQARILKMLLKGTSVEDLSKVFQFEYDPSKSDYYEELVCFHKTRNREEGTVRKNSTTNTIETDDDVSDFISRWESHRRKQVEE